MSAPPNTAPARFHYVGSELELFARASRWKAYWAGQVGRYVRGRVLDVGAGLGNNVAPLLSPQVQSWLALEPDAALVAEMHARRATGTLDPRCMPARGTLAELPAEALFDAILYIDVMEHIADDHAEAARAAAHLAHGGHLIVLVPAHQFLFSAFDAGIGHYRRYNRRSLLALAPPGCRLERFRMLDSVGFLASLANRLLLRAALPSSGQILLWDRLMVPLSRLLDPLRAWRFGKTAVAVWTRQS